MRNLTDKIPNAKNFKYGEFVFSETAIRYGLDNLPNENQWNKIENLSVNVLQPIRNRFGRIRILSGFRSQEVNSKIRGSSSTSNHCRGEASDIISVNGISLVKIAVWIYKNLEFRNLIFEYNSWIHIDYRVGGNLKKLKLKDKDHNYTIITIDELKNLYEI